MDEKEKLDRVSELLQEVKPYYATQRKDSVTRLKVACILCFGMFTGLLIGYFNQYGYTAAYSDSTEIVNEYGIPVDSYGLIDIN